MALTPRQRQVDPLQRQIDNARTRLDAVGMGDHDSRNFLERAFNLPEGQNAFFDILEVLQRPFQAGTNFASAALTQRDTRNPLTAAMQGLTGQSDKSYRDVLGDLGAGDSIGIKAAGTALDMLLDPINLVPGGAVAKGARAVGNTARKYIPEQAQDWLKDNVQRRLENAFSVDAPLRRTLDGGESDDLVNIRRQGINDERYYTQRILDNVLGAVRAADNNVDAGVHVGRHLESSLTRDLFDDAGKLKPGMEDVWVERVRRASDDPSIQRAADNIMRSNAEIRTLADEAGIDIKDIQGYMAHVLSKEAREAFQKAGSGRAGIGGNKRILRRELEGTAEEINKRMRDERGFDFDLFEPNAFFATAHGQRRVLQYILAERVKREVLSKPNFARKVDPNEPIGRLRPDEVLIDVGDYRFLKNEMDEIVGVPTSGDKYIVTKGAEKVLKAYRDKLSDDGVNDFIKMYDKVHNVWKKFALFSLGYHVRNDIGNKFNMWIAGMPLHQIPKYTMVEGRRERALALKAIEKRAEGKPLTAAEQKAFDSFDEFRRQGLSESSIFAQDFRTDPEGAITSRIKKEGRTGVRRVLDKAAPTFENSRQFGLYVDELNRYGFYKYLRDKGMSAEKAAEQVREVLFDYGDLTPLEQGAKRLFPFYTWMRKNIPFQLKNLATQPHKYSNLDKAIEGMYDIADLDAEKDIPDWLRDAIAVPIPTGGLTENPIMANLRPPAADLAEILESPLKTAVGALTPLVKAPIEHATNFNMFSGRPIEEFEGQTRDFLGMQLPAHLQHLISQLGAIRNLSTNMGRIQDGNLLEALLGGLLRETNPEQQHEYNRMNELRALQDLMRLVEQQTGSRPPTLQDLQR